MTSINRISMAILTLATTLSLIGCPKDRETAAMSESREARDPVWLTKDVDFEGRYRLRGNVDVLALKSESTLRTASAVYLSGQTETSLKCPHVLLFNTGDLLKVHGDIGAWTWSLSLKNGEVKGPLQAHRKSMGGNYDPVWLQTPPSTDVNQGSADPKMFDYYVMLIDTSGGAKKISKHYRVEAFPASGWNVGGTCTEGSCDCERPDAQGTSWVRATGKPSPDNAGLGESHSGEGDENQ